jgi:hypothetical protein
LLEFIELVGFLELVGFIEFVETDRDSVETDGDSVDIGRLVEMERLVEKDGD